MTIQSNAGNTHYAAGSPENYTIGGLRFHFREKVANATPRAITAVSTVDDKFTVAGDRTAEFTVGSQFTVQGSTGNDGTYTVTAVALVSTNTEISVGSTPGVASSTADGTVKPAFSAELYLGNVQTGGLTPGAEVLDHFTAKSGTRLKDRQVVRQASVTIDLTLDEPNVNNLRLFMYGGPLTDVAGSGGDAAAKKTFGVGAVTLREGKCRLLFVSDTGNEFQFEADRCNVRPNGALSYTDQDWSNFQLQVEVLDNSPVNPAEPFGKLTHFGTGANLTEV